MRSQFSINLVKFHSLLLAMLVAVFFTTVARAESPKEDPIGDAGRIVGNAKAPITVIEYASFTCPHCATFAKDIMPKLKSEWIDTGKAKWIFRDYPLDGSALKAAMIVRCAPAGKVYNFVEAFFSYQKNWATSSDPTVALISLGKLGGVSEAKLKACVVDKKLEDAILKQQLDGRNRYGVNSTPTIFINGQVSKGSSSWNSFNDELKAQLK